MHTHVQASEEQSSKQNQTSQKTTQLLAEPQTSFEDSHPQTAQLKTLQAMMAASTQQQKIQALQAKMDTSAHSLSMRTLQTKIVAGAVAQRMEEEEPLQAKFEGETAQRGAAAEAPKPNNTGLPNQLKAGIESLSGMSMDHVKVHYNSDRPAQLNAHAYTQGRDIHVAAGQEQHLPHEAWHVVQQAQGRVKPTMQLKTGVPVNDDAGLEAEADLMGAKAQRVLGAAQPVRLPSLPLRHDVGAIQRVSKKKQELIDSKKVKMITDSDENWSKLIMGFANKQLQWRSLSEFDATNILNDGNIRAPGGNTDIHKHVSGESAKDTAYISVSAMPTNKFRKGGVAAAVIKKNNKLKYIPNDALINKLGDDSTLIEYAGTAQEELYIKSIPQKNILLLEREINGYEMGILKEAIAMYSINKDLDKALEHYKANTGNKKKK